MRESRTRGDGSDAPHVLVARVIVTGLGVAASLYGLFAVPSNAAALIGFGAARHVPRRRDPVPARRAKPMAARDRRPDPAVGAQGRLGRENAMRNPRRTASTAAALMIGLGLVAMVSRPRGLAQGVVRRDAGREPAGRLHRDDLVVQRLQPGGRDEDRRRAGRGRRRRSSVRAGSGVRRRHEVHDGGRPGDDRGRSPTSEPSGRRDRSAPTGSDRVRQDDGRRGMESGRSDPARRSPRTGTSQLTIGGTFAENSIVGRELRGLARHVRTASSSRRWTPS